MVWMKETILFKSRLYLLADRKRALTLCLSRRYVREILGHYLQKGANTACFVVAVDVPSWDERFIPPMPVGILVALSVLRVSHCSRTWLFVSMKVGPIAPWITTRYATLFSHFERHVDCENLEFCAALSSLSNRHRRPKLHHAKG